MKLCIIGIGGCGGKVAANLLENQDIPLMGKSLGNHVCFGGGKGMWLEADVQEIANLTFFKPPNNSQGVFYPFYFIPHDALKSDSLTSRLIQRKYGYDLKKQGFFRQAEFLKAVFEIFEMDKDVRKTAKEETKFENPILKNTWNNIRLHTTIAGENDEKSHDLCDGILFVVSLGGGTGTGFINPITSYIRQERSAYPVFVLGVLTERGKDSQQNTEEPKRDLSAVISMHDLLTRARGQGIDGLILIDNQILKERFGGDYLTMDKFICKSMKSMLAARNYPGENPPSLAVREHFLESMLMPPILVPCYSSGKKGKTMGVLVDEALTQGRLFGCNPKRADRVYIFARGSINSEELDGAIVELTGLSQDRIVLWRKINDLNNEMLILLRNPYGSSDDFEYEGTLEHRLHGILTMSINYIDNYRDEILHAGMPYRTNLALDNYFYGDKGLKYSLRDALSRIESGTKPIFQNALNIFEAEDTQDDAEAANSRELGLTEGQVRTIIENMLKEKELI